MRHLIATERPDQELAEKDFAKRAKKRAEIAAKSTAIDAKSLVTAERPDSQEVQAVSQRLRDRERGPVRASSFSALKNFEECRYRIYLSRVKKIKGEQGDAAARGQTIHDQAEAYIRGEGTHMPPRSLVKLAGDYLVMRQRYEAHPERFMIEEDWGFDDSWQSVASNDYKRIWFRQKLDVFEFETDTSAIITDHKSGKKFGNEMKHADQGMQYAVGAFQKFPELQFVQYRFLYVDHGQKMERNIPRHVAMGILPRLEERIFAMTNATEEELRVPNPSQQNCYFCDHKKNGVCEFAQ